MVGVWEDKFDEGNEMYFYNKGGNDKQVARKGAKIIVI